jgi:hypothetical protein
MGGKPMRIVGAVEGPDKRRPADDWPRWTDADRYELGPDPEDARWASENLNGDDCHADEPTPDHVLDQWAGESEALDRHERGQAMY